jgi:hypothetical protein|tara:strand:+ start:767 stop:901 length:135 start_codon:yes stop_codon:yes gene_type:complete
MSEKSKDVVIHVTGVSMSGGVKNDSNRSSSNDKKESGEEKAGNS